MVALVCGVLAAGIAAPERASALDTELGGVDLERWCEHRNGGVPLLLQPAQGVGAAHNNWACARFIPLQAETVDMDDACRWAHSNPAAFGEPLDDDDAYSWRCYVTVADEGDGTGTSTVDFVALGDSYSSGEGNPPFWGDQCHRSFSAWPYLLSKMSSRLNIAGNWACSGATTAALHQRFRGVDPQLKHVDARTELVTVTLGGNDVGFADILKNCYLHNCAGSGRLERAERDIRQVEGTLTAAYQSLKHKSGGPVIAVGYPRLFPIGDEDCWYLVKREKQWLNELSIQMNGAMKAAARSAGVRFVSVLNALSGHELCTEKPWIYKVTANGGDERGHPTVPGQEAIARVVDKALSGLPTARRRCGWLRTKSGARQFIRVMRGHVACDVARTLARRFFLGHQDQGRWLCQHAHEGDPAFLGAYCTDRPAGTPGRRIVGFFSRFT